MEAVGLLSGAEAVGQAVAVILVWAGAIWLGVWFVRKLRRKVASAQEKFADFTDARKVFWYFVGCGTVSVAAHFLRLHWIEETAGGAAILFIVVGIVLEIDNRIKAVEARATKLEKQFEEKSRDVRNVIGSAVKLETEAKTIKLTNVDDPADAFLAKVASDDCAEASTSRGRTYVFLGITKAGEIWREKVPAGWQGRIKTYIRG